MRKMQQQMDLSKAQKARRVFMRNLNILVISTTIILSGCSTVSSKSEANQNGSKSEYKSTKLEENSTLSIMGSMGLVAVGIVAGLALIAKGLDSTKK